MLVHASDEFEPLSAVYIKQNVVGIVEFDILRRGIRRFPRRTGDGRRTWDPPGTGRAEGDRWKSQRWPGMRAIAEVLALQ